MFKVSANEAPFVCLRIEKFEELLFLRGFGGHFFRGQSDSKWLLQSSLERACIAFSSPPSSVEQSMLSDFMSKAHLYTNQLPQQENTIECLALMQHFGAPTRLLDFSSSPFVAAYFACSDLDEKVDGALWAMNWVYLFHWNHSRPRYDIKQLNSIISERKDSAPAVCMVIPERNNLRMHAQSGCFIAPSSLKGTFMDNLLFHESLSVSDIQNNEPGKWGELEEGDLIHTLMETHIVKVIIPGKLKDSIIRGLDSFQINQEKLFPDLAGLGAHQYHVLRQTKTGIESVFPGFQKK